MRQLHRHHPYNNRDQRPKEHEIAHRDQCADARVVDPAVVKDLESEKVKPFVELVVV